MTKKLIDEYWQNEIISDKNDSWDTNITSRTVIERVRKYYEDNRDEIMLYKKQYVNKEEYKIRKKEYDIKYTLWRSSWGDLRFKGRNGEQVINLLNIQGDVFA
tara:strand:- start:385 stop:693 length:309 start_codon:yes stop_codon:yes gene_type:complete